MPLHHPDKELYPNWTLDVKNNLFHKCLTVIQRMNPTESNLAYIRAFLDAGEFEYLVKRRKLDTETEENR